jgi:PD-(D/E)XK nuclease superfamily protein
VTLNRKAKGDLAELKVAADLVARGHKVAFPYGEDWDFDLIVNRGGTLERVQVKYAESDQVTVEISCRSHSLTNGKVRATKHYTAAIVDWLAVYDRTTERCYYVPATELGTGMSLLTLRLQPPLNGQVRGIRDAVSYADI